MPGSQALLITTLSAALVVGMMLTLWRSIHGPLAKSLGGEESRSHGPRVAFTLSLIPLMVVGGLLLDKWGEQEVLILGSLATALGVSCLALSRSYRAAVASAAVLGGGFAFLHTATAVLMPWAFNSVERPAIATSLGYLMVGSSALLLSGAIPLLQRKLGQRQCLLLLGLASLVPAAAAALTPAADFPHLPTEPGAFGKLLQDPRLWLVSLAFFLYHPLENTVNTWALGYLAEIGQSPRAIRLALLVFWLAFLGGRFLGVFFPAHSEAWVVFLAMLVAGTTLGNLVGIYRRAAGGFGFWVLGASLGPVFPALVAIVFRLPSEQLALALGIAFAFGASSSLILQPAVERYGRRHPVRGTMRVLMLVALLLAAPALVLCVVL